MNDPLRLGKEANQRYLMVDVHGFDGEDELILEMKPFEDRGRPFEVPVRF